MPGLESCMCFKKYKFLFFLAAILLISCDTDTSSIDEDKVQEEQFSNLTPKQEAAVQYAVKALNIASGISADSMQKVTNKALELSTPPAQPQSNKNKLSVITMDFIYYHDYDDDVDIDASTTATLEKTFNDDFENADYFFSGTIENKFLSQQVFHVDNNGEPISFTFAPDLKITQKTGFILTGDLTTERKIKISSRNKASFVKYKIDFFDDKNSGYIIIDGIIKHELSNNYDFTSSVFQNYAHLLTTLHLNGEIFYISINSSQEIKGNAFTGVESRFEYTYRVYENKITQKNNKTAFFDKKI